jgi:hypothetical protein
MTKKEDADNGALTITVPRGGGVILFENEESVMMQINQDIEDATELVPLMQSILNIIVNNPDMVQASWEQISEPDEQPKQETEDDAQHALPFPVKEV